VDDGTKPNPASPGAATHAHDAAAATDAELQAELDRREKSAFDRAGQQIRDAIASDPALSDLARQLMIDITPEGLRIQLVDADKQPMFANGSAALNERARAVLAKITPVLMRLPEQISISGHTDATPYKGADRTNWDLSADRANVTRRLLVEAGLPESRIKSVSGMADRDPLMPDDHLAAANRRIAIVVLRDGPVTRVAPKPGASR
jgi:chemotaxis protein MotB